MKFFKMLMILLILVLVYIKTVDARVISRISEPSPVLHKEHYARPGDLVLGTINYHEENKSFYIFPAYCGVKPHDPNNLILGTKVYLVFFCKRFEHKFMLNLQKKTPDGWEAKGRIFQSILFNEEMDKQPTPTIQGIILEPNTTYRVILWEPGGEPGKFKIYFQWHFQTGAAKDQ